MNRYSNVKGTSTRAPAGSSGRFISRMCWTCNKAQRDLGGKTHPRTRLWSCAGCAGVREAKVSHQGVRDTLAACDLLTSAEIAEFFPASLHRDVSAVLSTMRNAARKQVYIHHYTHEVHGETTHPRAVYALGDRLDAPKPKKQPNKVVRARYRAKAVKPHAPNSVWQLAGFL